MADQWNKIAKPVDGGGGTSTILHAAGKFVGILGLTYAGIPTTTGGNGAGNWNKVAKPTDTNWNKVAKPTDTNWNKVAKPTT